MNLKHDIELGNHVFIIIIFNKKKKKIHYHYVVMKLKVQAGEKSQSAGVHVLVGNCKNEVYGMLLKSSARM